MGIFRPNRALPGPSRGAPISNPHINPIMHTNLPTDFDELLAEREFVREQHARFCALCNEPDELGRLDSHAGTRDRWYARLEAIEEAIEEQCATERAEEES